MSAIQSDDDWPPEDGIDFIQSEQFAELLLDIVRYLSERYPNIDFTDAVARVFAWFDGKLGKEPDFINGERFRTPSALRAYIRQSVWNAARMSARERQRHKKVEALPLDKPIAAGLIDPETYAGLHEEIQRLPSSQRLVLERLFFDEESDLESIAEELREVGEERDVEELFEEAIDRLPFPKREERRPGKSKAPPPISYRPAQRLIPTEEFDWKRQIRTLPEPHKTVLRKLFFEEESIPIIGSLLECSEDEVARLYEEAIDMLDDS